VDATGLLDVNTVFLEHDFDLDRKLL